MSPTESISDAEGCQSPGDDQPSPDEALGAASASYNPSAGTSSDAGSLAGTRQQLEDFAARSVGKTGWFWETDADLRYTYFTAALDELRARSGDQPNLASLLGKTRWEIAGVDPDIDAVWRQHLEDMLARRAIHEFRYSIETDSGLRHLRVSGVPVFDQGGSFLGYRGVALDETEMVEAKRRAANAETLLSDAIESIPDGFVIFDADDRSVMCNAAYQRLYPRTCRHLTPGMTFEAALRCAIEAGEIEDARGREEEWLGERLMQHRKPGNKYVRNLPDGRWLLVTERRMRSGGTVGLRVDITAQRAAEARVEWLAFYDDPLTTLPSQALLLDHRLTRAINVAGRTGRRGALLLIELRDFHNIIAMLGVAQGDALLIAVSRRVTSLVRASERHRGPQRHEPVRRVVG